jgi:hypothetical protein
MNGRSSVRKFLFEYQSFAEVQNRQEEHMATEPKRKSKRKKPTMKPRKMRFTPDDENRIQARADLFAGGNFSKWVRHAALECPGKMLIDEN